jgi:hypothetical protein
LAILGALPKTGETDYTTDYYDQILGTTIADDRGSFGFSDFATFGGRIYGPEHHSNRRLKDPELDGGVLTLTSMLAEPDNAPAALQISGLAGNASTNLWGMRFFGTRIATFEAFRARLDKASRVVFYSAHIEGRNSGRLDTSGAAIDSNDYVSTSYGDVAGTDNTTRVKIQNSVKQSLADGAGPHYYGTEFTLETDSGRYFIDAYIEGIGELDLRTETGGLIRLREDETTMVTIDQSGMLPFQKQTLGIDSRPWDALYLEDQNNSNVYKITVESGVLTTTLV